MAISRSSECKVVPASRRTVSFFVAAFLVFQQLLMTSPVPAHAAVSTSVVISEFRTVGPSGGNDEFIELYNLSGSDVNIGGWKINGSNNAGTTSTRLTIAAGTILPANGHFLATNSAASGYSGSVPGNQTYSVGVTNDGGIALLNISGTLIDQVGMSSGSAYKEGTTLTPLTTNTNRCYERKPGGTSGNYQDTDDNSVDFLLISPCNPQNLSSPPTPSGSPTPTPSPTATPTPTPTPGPTTPSGLGVASPNSVLPGGTTLLSVTVTPGANPTSTAIAVNAELSSIGGSSSQAFAGNGNIFSFQAPVAQGTTPGLKNLPFTVTDGEGRTSPAAFISLNIEQPPTPANHVVISQIYGGGGNNGAAYKNDYVELYNPTPAAVSLLGWSLQYTSSTGDTWGSNTLPLYGDIGSGEYVLVGLGSGGATGIDVPAPNISGDINMSATTGKIALVANSEFLTGDCPLADPDVVDFVGYGTGASCWEGTTSPVSRAPAPSASKSIFRKNGGITDTDNNFNDFLSDIPLPRRTAVIIAPPEFGPQVQSEDPGKNAATAPRDATITLVLSEPVYADANWYNINCSATLSHNDATVAGTADGRTLAITPNVNFQPGEQCTVTITQGAVHDQDTDDSEPGTDTLPADFSWSFTVATGTAPPYGPQVHLTMGNPSGAAAIRSQPDNYLMEKPEYALSYNREKGTPNWVSWHLEDSWVGTLTRVDSFRPDPAVPSDWYRVEAFDFANTGFDRGHMTPNADRDKETSIPINQATFLMSNMVPQAPDNNQGPWADMENYLRSLLPANELYIVSGPAGVGGTGSNGGVSTSIAGGRITVPAYTWKVALVLPKGSNDIDRVTASTRTIAVIMPNTQGVRSNPWTNYLSTVDQVEALTGYDFFSNLPDAVENSIEAGTNGSNPPGVVDQSFAVDEDTSQAVTLSAASPDPGSVNFSVIGQPTHGSLTGMAPNLTYTPNADYNGPDSFIFRASNAAGASGLANVSITVNPVNDAPVAASGTLTTDEDTPSQPYAFAGTDADGDTITYEVVSGPAHGTVAAGVYTPDPNYNGTDSFSFVAKDAESQSAPATVSITVNPVNDAPSAAADSATTSEEAGVNVNVLINDSDIEGDTLRVVAVTQGSHGSVAINPDKSVLYLPSQNYFGLDSFTYTVDDGHGGTATGGVSVAISPVNDVPSVSNNLAAQVVQYSDTLQTVAINAVDVETSPAGLTASVSYSENNGVAWQPGVPAGLTFADGATAGTWTVFGNVNAPAGTYLIKVTVSDANDGSGVVNQVPTTFSVVVNKEKTATDYTGDFDLMTAGPAIDTATVRLAAQLTQDVDGSVGDLSKATATFKIFKFSATSPSYVIPGVPVNETGEAVTSFNLPADTYLISAEIDGGNGYWTADPINIGLLNIMVPSDEQHSSGGGWVPDTSSSTGKASLAFSVSASKNGQPKGNVSFSFRGTDGFTYLVKGNSWQGGYLQFSAQPGISPSVYTSSNIQGNCNVQKIDPATGTVVASFGNYTFEIFTRDGDMLNPREKDRYSITVRTNTSTVFHQLGSPTSLSELGGGNITNKAR